MRIYSKEKVYEESAFLAYYTHWGNKEIMSLPHIERVRWCNEISKINNKINTVSGHEEKKNIFSL